MLGWRQRCSWWADKSFLLAIFFFLQNGGRGDWKRWKGRKQGSQVNPPCHTVPLCHSRYQFSDALRPLPPPDPLPFFSFDNLPKHFIFFGRLIQVDNPRFSLVVDGLHLSLSLSIFFPLRISLSFFLSYPHPAWTGLISVRTNGLIVFPESHQSPDQEAYFFETWIGYPFTRETLGGWEGWYSSRQRWRECRG